ncbi:hypothetical protein, partial [Dokdonella sp.]|uniref:hypothetical protein n=1 Tax=Dokdonella sp. TaxID=2291710 RepID=UPI002B621929
MAAIVRLSSRPGIALFVLQYEPVHPTPVSLFGAQAAVFDADRASKITDQAQYSRFPVPPVTPLFSCAYSITPSLTGDITAMFSCYAHSVNRQN